MRQATTGPQGLLTEAEASQVLSVSVSTLQKWRLVGSGPTFRKLGRMVRYEPADLAEYIARCQRSSTSDMGSAAPSSAS